MKNSKIVKIDTTFKDLMYYWLKFIKPFHTLSEQPMQVLSLFLYFYFEYRDKIKDEDILWKMVFDYDTKVKISNELDVKLHTIENKLTQLRKKKIILDNRIDKRFIPNLERNLKEFNINYKFVIKDDK